MTPQVDPHADASIADLMNRLSSQTAQLIRDEIRLAQHELRQSAKHGGVGVGLITTAGLLAVLGLAVFAAAAIAAVSLALPLWAAALVVGAGLLGVSGIAAISGKRQLRAVRQAARDLAIANTDVRTYEMGDAQHAQF